MKSMLTFWEMRDSSMSFTPILPKPSHHTIHKMYFQEHKQHDISIPKGVTPIARTASSWKRAFPGTPEMHTIELMVHNRNTHHKLPNLHNLKYKVFALDRNLHLVVPNSL